MRFAVELVLQFLLHLCGLAVEQDPIWGSASFAGSTMDNGLGTMGSERAGCRLAAGWWTAKECGVAVIAGSLVESEVFSSSVVLWLWLWLAVHTAGG